MWPFTCLVSVWFMFISPWTSGPYMTVDRFEYKGIQNQVPTTTACITIVEQRPGARQFVPRHVVHHFLRLMIDNALCESDYQWNQHAVLSCWRLLFLLLETHLSPLLLLQLNGCNTVLYFDNSEDHVWFVVCRGGRCGCLARWGTSS